VGATVEADPDFIVSDGDVGGHVDEVAEDLARLGIVVAAHAAGHQTIACMTVRDLPKRFSWWKSATAEKSQLTIGPVEI
jgi:hypothetical protein